MYNSFDSMLMISLDNLLKDVYIVRKDNLKIYKYTNLFRSAYNNEYIIRFIDQNYTEYFNININPLVLKNIENFNFFELFGTSVRPLTELEKLLTGL